MQAQPTVRRSYHGMPAPVLFVFSLTILAIMLTPGHASAQELYFSVQTGSFKVHELAQNQFESLLRVLKEGELDYLRIERVDSFHTVRVGRFQDRAAAVKLLRSVQPSIPGAIMVRVPISGERIVRLYGRPSPEERTVTKGVSQPPERTDQVKGIPESPARPPDRRGVSGEEGRKKQAKISAPPQEVILRGKVIETGVVSGVLLGTDNEQAFHRLVILIEETEGVKGQPNLLKGKEGQTLTFFAEDLKMSDLRGKKIEAQAEYRGDTRGKLFWLKDIKTIK